MGEVFAGRYELIDMIGEGGMGGVWRAYDLRDRSVIAAKVLRQSDAGALLRFMREQGMRIHHPNVVTPLGWAGTDDRVLLTMPLVDGGSVAGLGKKHGALPPLFATELMRQLLGALAAVHEQRVVHRDVKPANLLLAATGTAKPHLLLTDFGIAISMDAPRLTSQNIVMGTPGYLAPEQLRGYDLDPRSDLYAAGMVGLQLLTGHKPRATTRTDPGDLPPRPQDVPDTLWQALARLAHPDIDRRTGSALEALDALNSPELRWLDQHTIDIPADLPPMGEAHGEFVSGGRTVAFGGDTTAGRSMTRGFDPAVDRLAQRAARARRLRRTAALVGAPLIAAAALTAIWLPNDGPKGTPGLARLGAGCSWADVGTTEADQNGVVRECASVDGTTRWRAVPKAAN
ncbi:serine/threonine-protein kinase [Calidifontibacter terrae]